MRPTIARFVLLGAALAAAACSSSSTSGGRSSSTAERAEAAPAGGGGGGGSLWDRLDAARTARRAGGTAAASDDAAAGATEVPAAERGRFEAWWKLYLADDPSWPSAKAEWRRTAPPGPQLLAENLLRRHVFAYDAGVRFEYERARRELVEMRDVAAPLAIAGLQRAAGDTLVRRHAVELIGAMGPDVVPLVERALPDAAVVGRQDLVRALGRMKSPATTRALSGLAQGRGPFEVRIEAVKALAENGDPEGYPAVAACLEDDDASVRKFAARYVAGYGRADVANRLVRCLERCERDRDREGVAEAHATLKKITGFDPPAESSAWRAVLARGAGAGR